MKLLYEVTYETLANIRNKNNQQKGDIKDDIYFPLSCLISRKAVVLLLYSTHGAERFSLTITKGYSVLNQAGKRATNDG